MPKTILSSLVATEDSKKPETTQHTTHQYKNLLQRQYKATTLFQQTTVLNKTSEVLKSSNSFTSFRAGHNFPTCDVRLV